MENSLKECPGLSLQFHFFLLLLQKKDISFCVKVDFERFGGSFSSEVGDLRFLKLKVARASGNCKLLLL